MARHAIGPEHGSLLLHTSRQGLAAQAGHDLVIVIGRWSGEVELADDPAASSVRVTAEVGSLTVRSGSGGVKPLSERDKREIARIAGERLQVNREPEATFVSDRVTANGDGGGTVEGTLTLLGRGRPFTLTVTRSAEGRYRATGTVVQTEFGIRPYTGLFGALKVADGVLIEAEFTLDH